MEINVPSGFNVIIPTVLTYTSLETLKYLTKVIFNIIDQHESFLGKDTN